MVEYCGMLYMVATYIYLRENIINAVKWNVM